MLTPPPPPPHPYGQPDCKISVFYDFHYDVPENQNQSKVYHLQQFGLKMQYLPVRALDLHFHGLKYLEVEGIGRRTGCQRPCNFRKYIFVQKGKDYPKMAKSLFLLIAT